MSLWGELKRRSVLRVGIAYLAAAWLLLQVASIVLPSFEGPAWVMQALIFSTALGFPLVVVLAWFYELTPEGIRAASKIEPTQAVKFAGRKLDFVIIGLLVVAVGFLVVDNYVVDEDLSTASIAVLPFDDLSPNQDQEYFSDGLTEEVLNNLAQINDLQVTGRTSSFYFKDLDIDLREIGQMLGVGYLLQGSLRKDGDQLRVTAQLIDAADGFQLWSDTYDQDLAGVFAIQEEIAVAVTNALRVTLGVDGFDQPGATRNVAAYEESLRSKALVRESTADSIRAAIGSAERAVALDPSYGDGWMELSGVYDRAIQFLPPEQTQGYAERRTAAFGRARAIMPDSPRVLLMITTVRGAILNRLEDENALRQLIDEGGSMRINAIGSLSLFLLRVGHREKALQYAEQAARLDPLAIGASYQLALTLFTLARYDEAQREIERGLEIEPGNTQLLGLRSVVAMEAGEGAASIAASDVVSANLNQEPRNRGPILRAFAPDAAAEDIEIALEEVRRRVGNPEMPPFSRYPYAAIAASLGNPELSLEIVPYPGSLAWAGYMREVRGLPQFKTLVRDNGMVEYWRETGEWADLCRPLGDDDFECF